jgi:aspartyl-tRNA(Asn)/glutamyl-tRNA(Gln) amidotransferase subunit C
MKVDNKVVDKLADLAKLEFDESSKKEIIGDLNRILTFVEKLEELDTKNVEPLKYITEEVNMMREDITKKELTKEDALKNAPKSDSDYFIVPKVLNK